MWWTVCMLQLFTAASPFFRARCDPDITEDGSCTLLLDASEASEAMGCAAEGLDSRGRVVAFEDWSGEGGTVTVPESVPAVGMEASGANAPRQVGSHRKLVCACVCA